MTNKKEEAKKQEQLQNEIRRVKMPRNQQTFGIIEQRLGGTRMKTRCMDGKTRTCSVPGKYKRTLWLREGDIVLVEPWEYQKDTKGNIIFKYRKNQVEHLKRKGHLNNLEIEEL